MEILVLVLIVGVAIAVGRLWSTATQESAVAPPAAETVPSYFSNAASSSYDDIEFDRSGSD